MLIVVAPDKFKGTLTGAEVAAAISAGVRQALPEARIVTVPVADGGEGTLAAALECGFAQHHGTVAGPTGEPVRAAFGLKGVTAIVEMAEASGLDQIPGGVKDALGASSFGTGQLISAALEAGATEIILGVGGSACTDGGAGMLQALGARLHDGAGHELPRGGGALSQIHAVDLAGLDARLGDTAFTLAADVRRHRHLLRRTRQRLPLPRLGVLTGFRGEQPVDGRIVVDGAESHDPVGMLPGHQLEQVRGALASPRARSQQ